uniref:Nucleotide-diphospho-sugar transferase domain-containing protein n=1 Tax=Aegilops tauschii subsp. strangulata TaxID=200361 RepID=A0A452Z0G4_AEGTS
ENGETCASFSHFTVHALAPAPHLRKPRSPAMSLHQRPHQKPLGADSLPVSTGPANAAPSRPLPLLTLPYLFSLLALLLLLALLFPWGPPRHSAPASPWRSYTLQDAAAFAAASGNGTIILAAISGPYLPFLSNWLISVRRAGRANQVLVIAEDYETLERINAAWPGHAVLVPPAPDAQAAHKFGSQGFFNFTSRRPRHLLQILELGYSVMYNDVDMVWLADPFPYLVGNHDVYFMDDMTEVRTVVVFVVGAVGRAFDDVEIVGAGEATESFTCAAAVR